MKSGILLNTILSVIVLISLGFLARRLKLLKSKDATTLNEIIIYLTLPAMIFDAVYSSQLSWELVKIPVVALFVMALLTLGCYFTTRLMALGKNSLGKKTVGAFLLAAAIGNTGYLGYPISQQIAGNQGLVQAIFYDLFGTVIFIFTVGLYIAESYGEKGKKINKLKEIYTFPPLIALLGGFLLRSLPVSMPGFFIKGINILGEATIPLIMLSIGLSLEMEGLWKRRDYWNLFILLGLFKLIISPLVALGMGKAFILSDSMARIAVLEASMPTVMLSLVFGLRYRLDTIFLSSAIFLTTLLSMFTIPLSQYIFNFL